MTGSSLLYISKRRYLAVFILVAALFPQLPPIFGRSEFHINIIALLLSAAAIFFFGARVDLKKLYVFLCYFLTLQLLLLLSYFFGEEGLNGLSDIPSLLRPIMLLVLTLGFSILLSDRQSFELCISIVCILTVISFIYALIEVFAFSSAAPIMYFFYRWEDKTNIEGASVSFFSLPYYAAYVHSILMLFILAGLSLRPSVTRYIILVMAIVNIMLTQSKTGIFVSFVALFMYWYVSVGPRARLFVVTIAVFFCVAVVYYLYDFVSFLYDAIGGNFAYTTLLILERPEEAGNLAERLNQVGTTLTLLGNGGWLVGLGLGKGLTLESWLAYVPYRYGGLGLLFFFIFYVFVTVRSIYLSFYLSDKHLIIIARIVAIWAFCLFFTQLSSLSMETSKSSIFTALMLALTSNVLVQRKSPKV